MNLYGSDLFGFPREWFSEERDDADVLAPPRFWIVAPRSFLLPDDEDDDFDDDVDPFNREHHREGEEKEATKTRILFSHKHTHTHTPLSLSLCVCVCRFLSENPLPLRDCCTRTILYRTSDEKRKKDILPEKKKGRKTCTRIRVEDPKQKKTAKNLSPDENASTRNKKRPRLV
jgi:hypothetical protein